MLRSFVKSVIQKKSLVNFIRNKNVGLPSVFSFKCTRCYTEQPIRGDELAAAETLWDYLQLHETLKQSDLILVCGNVDTRTADYASTLYLRGLAPKIIFSGNEGALTTGKWNKTEAEIFKDVAVARGVPESSILLEPRATNTGQNIVFSYQVLQAHNMVQDIHKFILIQMPHMERRTYATFMKQWPGPRVGLQVLVSSPRIPLLEYPNSEVGSLQSVITVMVGCLYRIKVYPDKGFQIPQDIPDHVWQCFLRLVATGSYNDMVPSQWVDGLHLH